MAVPPKDFNIPRFIRESLAEDIGSGDHTSLATIPLTTRRRARLIIKQNGILAGVALARRIFAAVDPQLHLSSVIPDGQPVRKGDIAFTVEGPARSILSAERLVLNCMQRMSGIATITNKFQRICTPYSVKVLDTRKTTPLFRGPEKWAVTIGGGMNHRYGLYDMILIKNNHIDYAGGIIKAIKEARAYLKKRQLKLRIVVEARNLSEVNSILETGGVHRILLDNFTAPEVRKAITRIAGKYETEISGGVNESNIRSYARCRPDFISIGALTHSAGSLNMSLTAY